MASFRLKMTTGAWEAWEQQGQKKTKTMKKIIWLLVSFTYSAFKYSEIIWGKLPNSGYKEISKCIWILRHSKGILGQLPGAQCNYGGFLVTLCKCCKIITWGKEWSYSVCISASVSALRDYSKNLAQYFFQVCTLTAVLKWFPPHTFFFFFLTFKADCSLNTHKYRALSWYLISFHHHKCPTEIGQNVLKHFFPYQCSLQCDILWEWRHKMWQNYRLLSLLAKITDLEQHCISQYSSWHAVWRESQVQGFSYCRNIQRIFIEKKRQRTLLGNFIRAFW